MKSREEFEAALKAQGIPMTAVRKRIARRAAARPDREPEGPAPRVGDGGGGHAVPRGQPREARNRPGVPRAPHPGPAGDGRRATRPGRTRASAPSSCGPSSWRAPTSPSWRSSTRAMRARGTAAIWEHSSAASSPRTSRHRSSALTAGQISSPYPLGARLSHLPARVEGGPRGRWSGPGQGADPRNPLPREVRHASGRVAQGDQAARRSSTCAWTDSCEKH